MQELRWMGLLLAGMLTGCSGAPDDQPGLAPVTGTVTLDGQPLPDALVTFMPIEGGQSSTATTDAAGNFELTYKRDIKGAKVGKHRISVSTGVPGEVDDSNKMQPGIPEKVPPQYNTSSILEREINPDENVVTLELESN